MKQYVLLGAAMTLIVPASYAQLGGIKKLKDKVETKLNEATKADAHPTMKEDGTRYKSKLELSFEKRFEEDKASTVLESKTPKKDSRNLGGIYYSNMPIEAKTEAATNSKVLGKFLVEYIEDASDVGKNMLKIYSQYAYEATNAAKLIKPLVYVSETVPKRLLVINSVAAGGLYLNGAYTDPYATIGRAYQKDLQENTVVGDFAAARVPNEIVEVEPGILIVQSPYVQNLSNVFSYDVVKKNTPLLVFYKPDKEKEAEKYGGEAGYEFLENYRKKFEEVSKRKESESVTLLKPKSGFKDEPTRAVLEAAMKKRMAREGWKEELLYVYPGTEWQHEFEKLGLLAQNTLMRRVLTAQAVFKLNGKYKVAQIQFQQDNTYTTGTFTENFKSNEIYVLGVADLSEATEAKALQYKK